MKKKWIVFLATAVLLLAACGGGPGGGPSTESGEPPAGDGAPQLASELSVYNWADYIDEELLTEYEREYGVKIIYDTFASNEDLLAKLQAGATGYDIIVPSDYMVEQMIELGLLAEIDANAIPNFANIDPDFKTPPLIPATNIVCHINGALLASPIAPGILISRKTRPIVGLTCLIRNCCNNMPAAASMS